jgi:hypothetical protein
MEIKGYIHIEYIFYTDVTPFFLIRWSIQLKSQNLKSRTSLIYARAWTSALSLLHMNGHMDIHKSETVENWIDMAGKVKHEPGTSHLLCIPDLVPRKKIPTHRTLSLELHENSLPQWFHQLYSKFKKMVWMLKIVAKLVNLKIDQRYFYAPYHVSWFKVSLLSCSHFLPPRVPWLENKSILA